MTSKRRRQLKLVAFRLPVEMVRGLEAIREQIGVPASETVRRAVARFLAEEHGIGPRAKVTAADARLCPEPTADPLPLIRPPRPARTSTRQHKIRRRSK